MANTKISQLTPNTNPTGLEEMVYAYAGTNGKMTLSTIKSFVGGGGGGSSYTPGTGIDITSDVISNTGVLSLNSVTGAIQLKTINGNNPIGVGNIDTTSSYSEYNYSSLRGPAPAGYHVPMNGEWMDLYYMMVSLGISTSNGDFSKYLKIPLSGYRLHSTGAAQLQGSSAQLYTATAISSSDNAYGFAISNTSVSVGNTIHRAAGLCIRAFKNEVIIPDNTWTTLFDGSLIATGAGIFWDSTNGYISISSTGEDWITIADKNIGATTAWSYGDALSQTNCGTYFQWGNNYGFAWSGSVTTSSIQVDASAYGPGNYYSGSSFIIGAYGWDSSQNEDLWGGVTGPAVTQYDIYNRFQLSGTNITIGGNCIGGLAGDELSGSYSLVTGNNSHIGQQHYLYIPTQTNSYSIVAGTGVNNPFGVTLPSSTTKSCLIKFYCDSVSTMIITDCLIAN